MTSIAIYQFNTVYRISNLVANKHYYGKHSSNIDSKLELGIDYFSSSTDEEFLQDQIDNPSHYAYKICFYCATHEEALLREMRLHVLFDVAKNPNFYNRSIQHGSGFDTTGQCCVVDALGNTFMISTSDTDYLAGKYATMSSIISGRGIETYFDTLLNIKVRVHKDIAKLKPKRYIHGSKGKLKNQVTVRDRNGNTFNVFKDDPKYLSGELVSAIKGQVTVCDENDPDLKPFNISKFDPRYLSGELKHMSKVFRNMLDKNGNKVRVKKSSPEYTSGEYTKIKQKPTSDEGRKNMSIAQSNRPPDSNDVRIIKSVAALKRWAASRLKKLSSIPIPYGLLR